MKYDHQKIEPYWQQVWEKAGIYQAQYPSKKKKYYVLIEFPYPSGERLHVGHARSYSAMDAIARKRRMQGYNVLYPIGWDAFGLPAENYAIRTGIHPTITTRENILNAKKQAKRWGLSFDWSREINTTDPAYYRWTQWIFLQFYKKGLAYRAEIPVNWCPSCRINLANEEVIKKSKVKNADSVKTGRDKQKLKGKQDVEQEVNVCERCGAEVTKRMQRQWMLKITAYADRLLKDLETVDYREDIKQQQVNWIGRKEGINIYYPVEGLAETLEVFTTRPDTNFGATFIVIAPDKKVAGEYLALKIATKQHYQKVKKYIENTQKKSELERIQEGRLKTGVFTGRYAINRLNNRRLPIWVSDFVLAHVGTGVVVGVPAHDSRDLEFSQKFNLPIEVVVLPNKNVKYRLTKSQLQFKIGSQWQDGVYEGEGIVINSGFLTGMKTEKAKEKIMDYLEEKGWGKRTVSYSLRDWVFSRQHYWGEPIPIIYCRNCWRIKSEELKAKSKEGIDYTIINDEEWAIVPVPEHELPVELPHVESYQPTDTGESPLAGVKEWVEVKCPQCGGKARRETDTMPNWAGSSWYFLAYTFADKIRDQKSKIKSQNSVKDKSNIFEKSRNELKYWLPVDWYNGGLEHTTLHLLYSRFWHKFLYDLGMVPTAEPYAKRTSHGVVLGPDGAKMSKSRGNVINPDEVVEKYGADSLRMYEMFMGPFEEQIAWDDRALAGVRRFLDRIYRLYQNSNPKIESSKDGEQNTDRELKKKLHQTIKKVSDDMEQLKFNTAIAALMEYINQVQSSKSKISTQDAEVFLRLLAPFAPHLAEELWQTIRSGKLKGGRGKNVSRNQKLGFDKKKDSLFESVHLQPWPQYEPALVNEEIVEFVVQVNGKVRAVVKVSRQMAKAKNQMVEEAKKSEKVQKYLKGKEIKKIIFVPQKLVNFVV